MKVSKLEADLTRRLVEDGGLHEYIRIFWSIADPGQRFVDGWHIGAIAEHLEAVSRRQIRRLAINIPPGSGKSTLAGVLWPAWHWTFDPGHRWICASFDQQLVLRDAERMLNVIQSDEYRAAWPDFSFPDRAPAVGLFVNGHGGRRFSTSVQGKGTGWHGDTQVCDDPNKALDARSPLALQKAVDWWLGTMSTRVCDEATHARVVIMQRLAEEDLTGVILRDYGYEHLCIPFRYDPKCTWDLGSSIPSRDPRTEPGEVFWPERYSDEQAEQREKDLGTPQNVAAQLQQNPLPDTGGIIERDWIQRWTSLPKRLRIVQSWDFGFKGKEQGHSRVVGELWAEGDGRYLLLDEVSGIWNYPESKRQLVNAQERVTEQGIRWDAATAKLIEDKANGSALIAELTEGIQVDGRIVKIRGMIAVEPKDDKATRLIYHSDRFRVGQVFVPLDAPWVEDWILEVVGFPRAKKDDRVDTTTQALDHLAGAVAALADALAKAGKTR